MKLKYCSTVHVVLQFLWYLAELYWLRLTLVFVYTVFYSCAASTLGLCLFFCSSGVNRMWTNQCLKWCCIDLEQSCQTEKPRGPVSCSTPQFWLLFVALEDFFFIFYGLFVCLFVLWIFSSSRRQLSSNWTWSSKWGEKSWLSPAVKLRSSLWFVKSRVQSPVTNRGFTVAPWLKVKVALTSAFNPLLDFRMK